MCSSADEQAARTRDEVQAERSWLLAEAQTSDRLSVAHHAASQYSLSSAPTLLRKNASLKKGRKVGRQCATRMKHNRRTADLLLDHFRHPGGSAPPELSTCSLRPVDQMKHSQQEPKVVEEKIG